MQKLQIRCRSSILMQKYNVNFLYQFWQMFWIKGHACINLGIIIIIIMLEVCFQDSKDKWNDKQPFSLCGCGVVLHLWANDYIADDLKRQSGRSLFKTNRKMRPNCTCPFPSNSICRWIYVGLLIIHGSVSAMVSPWLLSSARWSDMHFDR